jgi:uncharacterized OsmC-like protein
MMTAEDISNAIQRVRTTLARRPRAAIHADDPAIAHWDKGMRVIARHANGTQVTTDMPVELGGEGSQVSPGWLLRAGLASCLATRIVMEAAAAGVSITRLEVLAKSTSDVRGLLDMTGENGSEITPAPADVQVEVKISAPAAPRERLEAIVKNSFRCSPVSAALEKEVPVGLRIEFDPD